MFPLGTQHFPTLKWSFVLVFEKWRLKLETRQIEISSFIFQNWMYPLKNSFNLGWLWDSLENFSPIRLLNTFRHLLHHLYFFQWANVNCKLIHSPRIDFQTSRFFDIFLLKFKRKSVFRSFLIHNNLSIESTRLAASSQLVFLKCLAFSIQF